MNLKSPAPFRISRGSTVYFFFSKTWFPPAFASTGALVAAFEAVEAVGADDEPAFLFDAVLVLSVSKILSMIY